MLLIGASIIQFTANGCLYCKQVISIVLYRRLLVVFYGVYPVWSTKLINGRLRDEQDVANRCGF